MPNTLQLAFLLSAALTFGVLAAFTSLFASYFRISLPFFDILSRPSNKNVDMSSVMENIRSLIQTPQTLATASIIMFGACALLFFNLKILGMCLELICRTRTACYSRSTPYSGLGPKNMEGISSCRKNYCFSQHCIVSELYDTHSTLSRDTTDIASASQGRTTSLVCL